MKLRKEIVIPALTLAAAAALAWFFIPRYADFAYNEIILRLGLNRPRVVFWITNIVLSSVPALALGFGAYWVKNILLPTTPPTGEEQLRHLREAQDRISGALVFLSELRGEIEGQRQTHDRLKELVNTLESASRETTDELRKKLKAIEYVDRRREIWRVGIAFGLGVVSSLVASLLWTLVSK